MRVIQIINLGYEAGGAEKSVKLIKEELTKRGHSVYVVSTDKNIADKQAFSDFTVHAINRGGPFAFTKYLWNEDARQQMKKIIKRFNPDIIHIHTIGEFSPSILWAIGSTPAIMTVHGPEGFILKLLRWQLSPDDYQDRSYEWKDILWRGRARYIYYRFLQRPIYLMGIRKLRLVIAPSQYLEEVLKKDISSSKIVQLYNGIKLMKQEKLPKQPSAVFVGRVEAVKGVKYLIYAWSKVVLNFRGATLTIVGDGTELSDIKNLAKELRISDNVVFTGWVNEKKVGGYIKNSQMMVIPSIWPENLPTVAIEALSIGRPLIGSNCGGIPELAEDGVTGRIFKSGDAVSLEAALTEQMSNPKLTTQMASAAVKKSKDFSIKLFTDKLERLYEDCILKDGAQ